MTTPQTRVHGGVDGAGHVANGQRVVTRVDRVPAAAAGR